MARKKKVELSHLDKGHEFSIPVKVIEAEENWFEISVGNGYEIWSFDKVDYENFLAEVNPVFKRKAIQEKIAKMKAELAQLETELKEIK